MSFLVKKHTSNSIIPLNIINELQKNKKIIYNNIPYNIPFDIDKYSIECLTKLSDKNKTKLFNYSISIINKILELQTNINLFCSFTAINTYGLVFKHRNVNEVMPSIVIKTNKNWNNIICWVIYDNYSDDLYIYTPDLTAVINNFNDGINEIKNRLYKIK